MREDRYSTDEAGSARFERDRAEPYDDPDGPDERLELERTRAELEAAADALLEQDEREESE